MMNNMNGININSQQCTHCNLCAKICPSAVFEEGAIVNNPKACIECGHCIDVCPSGALTHECFPPERIHRIDRDALPSPEHLLNLMRYRRSNRSMTEKEIPEQALNDILEAARYAPTAENSRKVVVTVLSEKSDIQAVEDATMRFFLRMASILMSPILKPLTKLFLRDLYNEAPELTRFEKRWKAGQRPCTCNGRMLITFSAPSNYDFGYQDCNLAYQNASLMAESHGVSQVYMGLVQSALKFMGKNKVTKLLHLPKGHKPFAIMSIGIPSVKYRNYTER